jgi:Holliday junction resolvasome RuvABC endonuclease subunit
MSEVSEALQQLASRFAELVSLHENTRVAYEKSLADKQRADALVAKQAEKIATLEEKNKTLLVSSAFAGTSAGNNEAKEKIDNIVQEIDKCISLFNKQALK